MIPNFKPLARLAPALLALAIAPGIARGQSPSTIIDDAGMFSESALREARAELARSDRAHGLTVTVETVETLKGQGIDEFATRRAEQFARKGVYVLIARREHKAEVLAFPRSLQEELTTARLHAIRDAFTDQFRKNDFDDGLTKGVQAASSALTAARLTRRPEGTTEPPAAGTSAGSSPLILRQQVRLTLAGARKTIAGAEAKATEKGYKMNIAAVDDGGHLMAFERMDGARPASVATATTKAITAATFRQATGPMGGANPDVLLNISLQNAAAASGGKLTTLHGGVPIVVDGQVIGALGVGGGSGEQDAEVARAGVEAFLAGLQEKPAEKEKEKEAEKPAEPRAKPEGDTPPK